MRPTVSQVETSLRALSGALAVIDRQEFPNALVDALRALVRTDRALVARVPREGRVRLLVDQGAGGVRHARVADPSLEEHRRWLRAGRSGCLTDARGAEAAHGWLRPARHFAFLAPVSDSEGLVLVLLRQTGGRGFSAAELGCLRALESGVCKALRVHWESCAEAQSPVEGASLHHRVEAALDHFGHATLTPREGQVIRLLLRGQSTKAAAERLGIAAATTALHRKRAYAKLGVRSQAQLFHHFIQSLARVPGESGADGVAGGRVRELPRRQPSAPSAVAGLS